MPSPIGDEKPGDEKLSAAQVWIKRLLDHVRSGAPPAAPIALEWHRSLGDLVCGVFGARRLPAPLVRRLARWGELYLSPNELGLDGQRVRWDRIEEIRTRNARDVLVAAGTGKVIGLAGNFLPRFLPSRWVTTKAQQIVSALLRAALDKVAAGSRVELPSQIVYRGRFGRRKHLSVGLFPSSLLVLLPEVTRSMATTAQRHQIPVRSGSGNFAMPRGRHGGPVGGAAKSVSGFRGSSQRSW